jgi:transposase-like protein
MARIPRKSDGRRIFTAEFKRDQIARVLRGELTISKLSRKLGIAPSLLHRWKRLMPDSGSTNGVADGSSTSVSNLGTARYIRELQVLVGKQLVELELLRAEVSGLKKAWGSKRVSGM